MKIVCLSGGVGGAKLALGLSKILGPEELTIVANTGDDFEHMGLLVCPDIDTLIYTLSGLAHQEQGWGRGDESGAFMETMKALGGPDWFYLGDRDLALHHRRRQLLDQGLSLTDVTGALARALGVAHPILPMSENASPTMVEISDSTLSFQDYFVRFRASPVVTGLTLHGGQKVALSDQARAAIAAADAVIVSPSNPLISIDPIRRLDGFDALMRVGTAPVIAVSPIVGGQAIKGPTAKMMGELGMEVSVTGVARHYAGWVDHLVLDTADAGQSDDVAAILGQASVTGTVMRSLDDRIRLAEHVLKHL